MYIQSQDGQTMINFDNFHALCVNDTMLCAIKYQADRKVNVVLGTYDTHEEAIEEFESIMEDMMDEGESILEVD